ncbi:CIR protein, fragment [Plasmodium vinckei brucechwatti]|uniref:CIR protein n=1 Tax=Plasmodium vinckei brucechwatti TaxID=119398 RepID=A0A6V7RTP8_PLAVN|nr:CIR protein, fragment [Plasmodium vinckei brucechwatti]
MELKKKVVINYKKNGAKDKLKNIYVDFRDLVIKKETGNNNLYQQRQNFPTENKSDSYFAKSFEAFDFNNLKCKPKNKVNIPSDKNKTQETKATISKSTNKLKYPL